MRDGIYYSDMELNAIAILKANRGVHLSAKELGISKVILINLVRKGNDDRPMADGITKVKVNAEQYSYNCFTCGVRCSETLYWID